MKKKNEIQLTPEQIAEKAHAGWKASSVSSADALKPTSADVVGTDTEQILSKHKRVKSKEVATAKTARKGEATIVHLEPEVRTDRLGPRRSSVIQDGEEIGHSG